MTNSDTRPPAKTSANRIAAVVAICVAAVAAAAAVVAGSGLFADGEELVAVVHASDGSVVELPLSTDAVVVVSTEAGENEVTVRDGSVFVSDADCGNHDCMRQGALMAPGRQIICLPHELWIEVVAAGSASGQMDVSAVSGPEADQGEEFSDVDVLSR